MLKLLMLFCAMIVASTSGHSQEFKPTTYSIPQPSFANGIWTARINGTDCVDDPYPQMTETPCNSGNRHSMISSIGKGASGGQSWEYGFKFRIPEGFEYVPWEISTAQDQWVTDNRFLLFSRLNLAAWQRDRPKNVLYLLKLDSVLGVTFQDAICASPAEFGQWVDFHMAVQWGRNGYIRVSCNNEVIFEEVLDHTVAPWCTTWRHCVESEQKRHARRNVQMQIGLWAEAKNLGVPWVSDEGFAVEFREPIAQRIDNVFTPIVEQVQQALFDLGFDPNGIDGQVGRGTRTALKEYKTANGLEPNDRIDPPLLRKLGISKYRSQDSHTINSPDELTAVAASQESLKTLNPAALIGSAPLKINLIAADVFGDEDRGSEVAYFAATFEGTPYWQGHFRFHVSARHFRGVITGLIFMPDRSLGTAPNLNVRRCYLARLREFDNHYYAMYPGNTTSKPGAVTFPDPTALCAEDTHPSASYTYRLLKSNFRDLMVEFKDSGNWNDFDAPVLRDWIEEIISGELTIE